MHIEELHEFVLAAYHSNEKSKRVKCPWDVTRMGGGEMNSVLMEMYEGKSPPGTPRRGGENNIKTDLKIIIGC